MWWWLLLEIGSGYYYQIDTLHLNEPKAEVVKVFSDAYYYSCKNSCLKMNYITVEVHYKEGRQTHFLTCDTEIFWPMDILSVRSAYRYKGNLLLVHGGIYQVKPTGFKKLYYSYSPPYISNPFGNHQVFGRNGRIYVRVYHGRYWTYYRNRFLNPAEHPFAWFRIKEDTAVLEGFWGRYPYRFLRKKLTLNYGLKFVWCDLWVDTLCLPERIYVKFWYDDTIVEYDPFGEELRRYWAPQSYRILGVDSCYIYGKYQSEEGSYLWIHSKSDGRFVGALPYFSHWRYVGIVPKEGVLYFSDERVRYRVYKVRIGGVKV